uniref:Uncharacterized protein n=1 Tax=Marseillevirus sp. TaxID=2809551 RepID=A0AA96IY01_9VIRU|nr:hypothetical protein MarFTMF_165 [Marseillevirus sp.]
MFFVRRFERNPLYVPDEILHDEEINDNMPSLISDGEMESEEFLQSDTLLEIRDQIYGGFDHDGAFNVLCSCCAVYNGQKNVVVLVKGNTSTEVESFKDFSKFESSAWF